MEEFPYDSAIRIVKSLANKYTLQPPLTFDDVVQEGLMVAWQAWNRWLLNPKPASYTTYLYGLMKLRIKSIVYRPTYKHCKERSRSTEFLSKHRNEYGPSWTELGETWLSHLPPKERIVMEGVMEGRTLRDIAKEIRSSHQVTRGLYLRGIHRLRRCAEKGVIRAYEEN